MKWLFLGVFVLQVVMGTLYATKALDITYFSTVSNTYLAAIWILVAFTYEDRFSKR